MHVIRVDGLAKEAMKNPPKNESAIAWNLGHIPKNGDTYEIHMISMEYVTNLIWFGCVWKWGTPTEVAIWMGKLTI